MMKTVLALAAGLALTACTLPEEVPVVSDFNGDSVKLQMSTFGSDRAKLDAEAQRICQRGGKRRAEAASSRQLGNYQVEYLYLCLN